MSRNDKRLTNFITGQEREEVVFSLIDSLYKSGLIAEKPIQMGGRNYNYDILLNEKKIEIKDNSSRIDDLPEILQLSCSSITPSYIDFHYDNVICEKFSNDIDYDDYIKNINSSKHEGVFKEINEKRKEIEELTKSSINSYIQDFDENDFVPRIITKLKEQTDKTFILFKNNKYKYDKLDDEFENIIMTKNKNKLIIETDKWCYYCLLRWKNGIGVNYPAWQISAKRKQPNQTNVVALTHDEIKKFGIFFTPQDIVNKCLSKLDEILEWNENMSICEPSCGLGVFIDSIISQHETTNLKFTCYELNQTVYNSVKSKYIANDNITIHNCDYLTTNTTDTAEQHDLIIGNPPYVLTKSKQYKEFINGRNDVFIQFLIHSLLKLKDNGVICFVIPLTFLNCVYYSKVRDFIKNNSWFIPVSISSSNRLFSLSSNIFFSRLKR